MHNWLQDYQYHTELTWWIFLAVGAGALTITLLRQFQDTELIFTDQEFFPAVKHHIAQI